MKLILIAQTLIIILGGYYIYTLSKGPVVVEEVVPEEVLPVVETRTVDTATTTVVETTVAPAVSEDLDGPHDQGMEWPTLEEDIQVR
jgi:hypothetical protein